MQSGASSPREDFTSHESPHPELWVRLSARWTSDPELHWLIAGSAHTHRGHFHVCSADGEQHRSVNYADVVEASLTAQLWLDGFLHGQQASLWQFLGEDGTLVEESDPADVERWTEWNRQFRRLGHAWALDVLPPRVSALDAVTGATPWCYVGGLFRVWSEGDWHPASPQPGGGDDSGWVWPGSQCDQLGKHELCDDEGFAICERCHLVEAM